MLDKKKKIIIDTDVGTNADDAITITLALNSPEIEVLGITTVHGDTQSRAQTAYQLLSLFQQEDIPVFRGAEHSLLNNRPIDLEKRPIFTKWCASDFLPQDKHAVSFIIDTIMKSGDDVTLVLIGPLTNIALALNLEPRIESKIKEIVMMGGVTHLGEITNSLPKCEYNISSDPEAAYVVFNSSIPITMFGLDITYQIKLLSDHIEQLKNTNKKSNLFLIDMLNTWMRVVDREFSYMCDPLTILYLTKPSLFEFVRMNVDIEYTNEHPSGCTVGTPLANGRVNVCLDANKECIISELMQILTQS